MGVGFWVGADVGVGDGVTVGVGEGVCGAAKEIKDKQIVTKNNVRSEAVIFREIFFMLVPHFLYDMLRKPALLSFINLGWRIAQAFKTNG